MRLEKRTLLLGAVGAIWLACSVGGLAMLSRYAYQEGGLKPAPSKLPEKHHHEGHRMARLLMFLHPECPCSEASVEELNRLVASHGQHFSATVYLHTVGPHAGAVGESPLGSKVQRIPGVEVRADEGGLEARRFGAETSGTVVLYDAAGALRFQGGLTESRGHFGDNDNSQALQRVLTAGTTEVPVTTTHVFGCSLF